MGNITQKFHLLIRGDKKSGYLSGYMGKELLSINERYAELNSVHAGENIV
jgi:hypothetical protein